MHELEELLRNVRLVALDVHRLEHPLHSLRILRACLVTPTDDMSAPSPLPLPRRRRHRSWS